MRLLQRLPSQTLQSGIEAFAVFKRFASSLTAVPEKDSESLQGEPIQVPEAFARVAGTEVVLPPTIQDIDLMDRVPQGVLVAASSQGSNLFLEGYSGLLGRKEVQISTVTTVKITVVAHRKSEKIKACTFLPQLYDSALFPVYRQSQFVFKLPFEPVCDSTSHVPSHDDEIVRVSDDSGIGKVSRRVGITLKGTVQLMQEDIGEQWRNDSMNTKGNFLILRLLTGPSAVQAWLQGSSVLP